MREMVRVRCLRHVYPDRTEVNLCGLDLVIEEGQSVAILGPNGSGKTTLLFHILGLLKPLEGEVRVLGLDPVAHFDKLRTKVGVVFQNVEEQIIGPTVFDDIAFAPRSNGIAAHDVGCMVEKAMKITGVAHLRERIVHYLSGGEKKKVAIAGAMVVQPEILILDEPFDGLDPRSREEITGLLHRFNRELGTTIILTTHDMNLVPRVADHVCVINAGRIELRGRPYEVLSQADSLRRANLEPPALVELFAGLSKHGVPVLIPSTTDGALEQLLSLLRRK